MDSQLMRETSESIASTAVSDEEVLQHVESVPHTPPTPNSPGSPFVPKDSQKKDILGDLWRLHADELTWLAQRKRPVVKAGEGYFPRVSKMVRQFVHYLWKTWSRCLWGLVFLPGTLLDKISMLAFAFFSSLILGVLLLWCTITTMPLVQSLFRRWSLRYAGGLSLANASYPRIFHQLSFEQIQASREALSQPMPPRHSQGTQTRIFNLDIATLLFQCSALMYERTSEPLQGALETTREALQEAPFQKPSVDSSISRPGEALQTAVGSATAKQICASLHQHNDEESEMARFAARLGIEYATVSELNSQTSAFCGCFWDPNSNYIILAFKGTGPTEFVEWAGDFSYETVEAGDYIRGFGRVHGGFMERVFPRRIQPGARLPYYTIRDAVRHTSAHLRKNLPPGTKINVWFTGHSLGTALASLVYARAINEPHEFGRDVVLRDAYLFATPILADVQSVHAFHNRLNHDPRRTMWRVTNGLDAVATALPDSGDNMAFRLSPYNLFSFAHLGMELTLREAPAKSVVSGNALAHGTIVCIESAVKPRPIPAKPLHGVDAADERAIEVLLKLERVPMLGRLLAHGTAPYWYMLQNIQLGECDWQD